MSYATATLATYANMLGTLDDLVIKASAHEKGAALLQARLAEDMFPLHTQIRFTIAQVLIALDRLGNEMKLFHPVVHAERCRPPVQGHNRVVVRSSGWRPWHLG